MIDDEQVDRRFTEIVNNQYIDESRFPILTKLSAMIGEAVIMTINAKNLYTGKDYTAYIDQENVDLRTKSKIGRGVVASVGFVAVTPVVVKTFSTIYSVFSEGFRQL